MTRRKAAEAARPGRTLPSTARHALQSFGADWPEWAQVAVNDVIDQAREASPDTGELARLREALGRYGRHEPDCEWQRRGQFDDPEFRAWVEAWSAAGQPCSCGLRAALEGSDR